MSVALAPWLLLVASGNPLLTQEPVVPEPIAVPAALAQGASAESVVRAGSLWRSGWISVDRASFGFERIDGSLVAEGAGYHVTFDHGSFRFLPALGRSAPADRPVRFAVETIARGDAVLYREGEAELPQQPSLAVGGAMATWNRGNVLERFEARADGLEHSFVFAARPAGAGDLVVRLRVETELLADAGRDLHQLELFEPGFGKVTIGAVTGVDAHGLRAPGSMNYDGRHLELVLPARFVETAAYPMVLDPLIGSGLLVANPADNDRLPDCAYDLSTDRYLIVWERFFSTTNIVVRGRLLQVNGTFTGPGFIAITDQGGLNESNPKVANLNTNNAFVVVWTEGAAGAQRDIACRQVGADATLGPILVVATGGSDQVDPDVGGEATLLSNDVIIVFRDATAGILELRQVDFDPATGRAVLGRQMLVAGPSPAIGRVSISKSGGTGRKYFVCWDQGGIYLGGRVVNHDATAWSGIGLVSGREPEKVDVDGDGIQWTMVWNELEPGQPAGGTRDVWAMTVNSANGAWGVDGKRAIAANPLDDEAEPAVAFYGNAATRTSTVAWYDATARPASVLGGTNLQRGGNLRSGNPFATGPTSGFQVRWPSFATELSGGETSADGLLAFWANNLATLDGDVYVQLHRAHLGGPFSTITAGCSGGGHVELDYALAFGRRTEIRLRQADPSANLGFLLVGDPSSTRISCGSCTLLSTPLVVAVGMSSGAAAFSLLVPGDPSFTGVNLDLQFAVIGPQIQACALVPGLAASDILRATIRD